MVALPKKVAIVTDSTAHFEPGEAEKLGIHIVPLDIRLANNSFKDGKEIDTEELFRRLDFGGG